METDPNRLRRLYPDAPQDQDPARRRLFDQRGYKPTGTQGTQYPEMMTQSPGTPNVAPPLTEMTPAPGATPGYVPNIPAPAAPTLPPAPPPPPSALPPPSSPASSPPAAAPAPTPAAQTGQLGSTAVQPGQPATIQTQFRDQLLGLLAPQGQVTTENPNIAPVIAASRGAEQRRFDQDRAVLAEQGSATGTSTEAGLRGLMAGRAEREVGTEANLVLQETNARRQELMSALTLGGQFLSDEQKLQAEAELARLDREAAAAEGAAERGLRGELGRGDLGLRQLLGERGLDVEERLGGRELDIRELLGLKDIDTRERGLDIEERLGGRKVDIEERLGLKDLDIRELLGLKDIGAREKGIDVQERLGFGDIDVRRDLGKGQLSLDLLSLLLGERFRNTELGVNTSLGLAGLNRDSILNLLG